MSYEKERAEFVARLVREFPKANTAHALDLLRWASGAQRQNEIECSFDVGEVELARMEKRGNARDARVAAMVAELGGTLETGGDPRGYPYKLTGPSGREIGVPGRGLPARCFQ